MPLAASFPPPGSAPDPPGGSIPPGPPDPGASCRAKPRPARGPALEPPCEGSGGIMPPAAGGIFSSPGRCPGPAGGNPSPRSPRPGGIVPRKPRPARGPVPEPLCEGSGGIMPPAAGGIFSSPGRCPGPAGGNPSPRSPRPGGIVPRKLRPARGPVPEPLCEGSGGTMPPAAGGIFSSPGRCPGPAGGKHSPRSPRPGAIVPRKLRPARGPALEPPLRGVRGHHAPGRRRHLFFVLVVRPDSLVVPGRAGLPARPVPGKAGRYRERFRPLSAARTDRRCRSPL